MGNLSKYRVGNLPIGATQFMPNIGALLTLADSSKWLRTGIVVPKAPYPQAATIEHLGAHIFSESASAAVGAFTGIATNGAGVFVAGFASSTQLYVSTDYGVTWTTRNHGAGGTILDVCWAGDKFIAVGNDDTRLFVSTSADGVTWSGGVASTVLAGTASPNTTRVRWTGTVAVAACRSNDSSRGIWVSATGLFGAWTSKGSGGTAMDITPELDGHGNTIIILRASGGTTHTKSVNGGTSFSPMTLPVSVGAISSKPIVLAGVALVFTSVNTFIHTTDVANLADENWSKVAQSIPIHSLQPSALRKTPNGRVYCQGAANTLAYSDNGLTWKEQALAWSLPSDTVVDPSQSVFCFDDTAAAVRLGVAASVKPRYAASTWGNPNGVGIGVLEVASSSNASLYVRIA